MGGEAALAASSHDPHLGASARAHPRTPARCRLYAQAVAAAQRSDCHRTGASISGVMCGVSRPARAFWQPSNVQGSVASFSGPVHGRARALMPQDFPLGCKPMLIGVAVHATMCGPDLVRALANAVFQALTHLKTS